MPFTQTQRTKIRMYLGWTEIFRQGDALEAAMDLVGAKPEAQTEVERLLGWLDELDVEVQANTLRSAKATQVGGMQLRGAYALGTLYRHGRELVGRLARMFDVTPQGGVFGADSNTDTTLSQG